MLFVGRIKKQPSSGSSDGTNYIVYMTRKNIGHRPNFVKSLVIEKRGVFGKSNMTRNLRRRHHRRRPIRKSQPRDHCLSRSPLRRHTQNLPRQTFCDYAQRIRP